MAETIDDIVWTPASLKSISRHYRKLGYGVDDSRRKALYSYSVHLTKEYEGFMKYGKKEE